MQKNYNVFAFFVLKNPQRSTARQLSIEKQYEKEIVLAIASQKTIQGKCYKVLFTMQNATAADNCQSKMWNRMLFLAAAIDKVRNTHKTLENANSTKSKKCK